MGASAKAQELRDLLSLAKKLRNYAGQTGDAHYIALFLATAEMLETRAGAIAHGTPPPREPPQHIDLTC
jgi:hypothetical protein